MTSFRETYGPWAIIAGASEGTGRAFARKIAAEGVACILIANSGPLEEAAEEIRRETGVECLTANIDLAAPDAFDRIVEVAGDRVIGLYVSNAGTDPFGIRFLDGEIAGWLRMVRINVDTMVQSAHHFGGQMRERGRGGIILVNSGACYGGSAFLAMYTACKGFLLNFGESLWTELRPHGVDVLNIVLGQTDTPAYHKLQAKKGMPASPRLAAPDDVAALALARLPHGPVCNWGQEDEDAGYLPESAAARRKRVEFMDSAVEMVFGKQ
jgi:short-subunit dehydrogenase